MAKLRMMEIPEIRETLNSVVQEKSVAPGSAEAARNAIISMCQEASDYGLTSADVIRSVLSPLFESKSGCGCPTCQFRRGKLDSESHEPAKAH